jgi:hypothetical protein
MDRIYAADSKLVSLFHRYADDNGFLNIYKYKTSSDGGNLTRMSPSYWYDNYHRNFIVDLEYVPLTDHKDHKDLKWFYEDPHTVNRKLYEFCFRKNTDVQSSYLSTVFHYILQDYYHTISLEALRNCEVCLINQKTQHRL